MIETPQQQWTKQKNIEDGNCIFYGDSDDNERRTDNSLHLQ